MNERKIKVLTDSEHVLLRPNVYIGSVKPIKEERYILDDNKFVKKSITYVPGLVKIFEEILDNSVDAFVDNNFNGRPKIEITLEDKYFEVIDNGVGIPNEKHYNKITDEEEYMCKTAWGSLRAGSNFNDSNRKSIGTNGVGSFLSNIFSLKFIGENKNNGIKVICQWGNNAHNYEEKIGKSKTTGVKVYCEPDFERFSIDKFTDNEKLIIKSRIKMLAYSYPEIKFILNKEQINNKEIDF